MLFIGSGRSELRESLEAPQSRRPILHSAITEGLPALPRHVFALSEVLNSPQPDMAQVAAIFRNDPSLTAQLLRAANSAYTKVQEPIWSIEQAVSAVGRNQLRTLALTCPLARENHDRFSDLAPLAICLHGIMTARLARAAAAATGYAYPELAFVAGLIHDVGKIPFMLLEEEKSPLPVPPAQLDRDSTEWELVRYGLSHCETGRAIGVAWSFPEPLIEVLEFHHQPQSARVHRRLTGVVAAVDEFCLLHHLGNGVPEQITLRTASSYLEKVCQCLPDLPPEDCARFAEVVEEEWGRAIRHLQEEWNSESNGQEKEGAA